MNIYKRSLAIAALALAFIGGITAISGLHRISKPVHAAVPAPDRRDVVVVTMECYYPQASTTGPVVAASTQSANGSYTLPSNQTDCTNGLQSLYEQGLNMQSFGVIQQTSQSFTDTSGQASSVTTAYTTAQYLQWVLVSHHQDM